ncbi:unnamed protein product [marine sediment metagenome]|uniref:Uncharacterized protein n=1 Tax=marine sediment metagenome TaxID=412755 RepID=X1CD91_9ZZZZ
MAWGGSLNKEGSDYVRNLREADNALKFLEGLKRKLNKKEKQIVSDTINIIVNHYNKESKNESQTLK